jgi:hypothetical protein
MQTKPPLVFPPVMVTTLADERRAIVQSQPATMEQQFAASLLLRQLLPAVTLIGALVRHQYQGDPLPDLVKDVTLAWASVAKNLLNDTHVSVTELQTIMVAADRFLKACAGVQQS